MELDLNDINKLTELSKKVRRDAVTMAYKACSSHVGAALSMADILVVLYSKILNLKGENMDKFILSKGHASAGLYATLAENGIIDKELLDTYCANGSHLSGHPKRGALKGIEASTGSLGHGLAIGCGIALANKNDKLASKAVVLMGDGECDEGSVWEAAMFASSRKLNNLIAIVDNNKFQGLGKVSEVTGLYPLVDKWKAFKWNVITINGHDYNEIYSALKNAYEEKEKPTVIIADTIKGKGVSFMEGKLEWHYKSPNEEQYKIAMEELR